MLTVIPGIQTGGQRSQGRAETTHVLATKAATQVFGCDQNLQSRHGLWIGECLPRRLHQVFGGDDPLRIGQRLKRCDETVNGIFNHRSQQTIPIPEVVLNDAPTHPGSFDDVSSTRR